MEKKLFEGGIFWIIEAYDKLCNIIEFRKFCKINNLNEDNIFEGYKKIIEIFFREYINLFLYSDDSLGFTEDFKINRAIFRGIDKNKITPNCEKANLIKNIDLLYNNILESNNFDELKIVLDKINIQLVTPLRKIFEESININPDITTIPNKYISLKYININCCVLYLQYVGDFILSPLEYDFIKKEEKNEQKKYLDSIFEGYKIGLYFLWNNIFIDEENHFFKNILKTKNWEELHEIYKKFSNYIDNIETKLSINFLTTEFFKIEKAIDKNHFSLLIKKSIKPKLNLFEKIDELLYWYNFEVIDSARSKIFSGAPAFISLLKGEILEYIDKGIDEKLNIIRFVHEGKPTWFSYAILLQRHGSFSDFSGWLIFTECGGDYAGMGGNEYHKIENELKIYSNNLIVRQFKIDLDKIIEYFVSKIDNYDFSGSGGIISKFKQYKKKESNYLYQINKLKSNKILDKEKEKISGLLLHILTFIYFSENEFSNLKISYNNKKIVNGEIDIIATKNNTLFVIETTTNLSTKEEKLDIISRFKEREKILLDPNYKDYKILEKILVIPENLFKNKTIKDNILNKIKSEKIKIMEFEKEILHFLPRYLIKEGIDYFFNK